ncbi:MAG: hypothetical protein HZB61_12895 [Nitrospirae bacterium]|nr:hypothetical protein [Nitrospirota bacterium]
MPNIRIKPVDRSLTIGKEELNGSISKSCGAKTGMTPFPAENQYLLGMPVFDSLPFKSADPVIIPVEQLPLALNILKHTQSRSEMVRQLKSEYKAVAEALLEMHIDFQVLNLQTCDAELRKWLMNKGCGGEIFPLDEPDHWQIYPRDMFVYLKQAGILLVHSRLFRLKKDRSPGCKIIHTDLAEGGRVLFSGRHLITGCHPDSPGRGSDDRALRELREKGIRTTVLPHALFYGISRRRKGKSFSLHYDFHIDRSASLLKGKDNEYYLLLDPGYRTGPLMSPLSAQRSIDIIRGICDRSEVHVRVPEKVSVPYGTAVVQFHDGKVLMSSGDDAVLSTVEDIVGSGNLHVTGIPVAAYPVFTAAGLHCLITEKPSPLF